MNERRELRALLAVGSCRRALAPDGRFSRGSWRKQRRGISTRFVSPGIYRSRRRLGRSHLRQSSIVVGPRALRRAHEALLPRPAGYGPIDIEALARYRFMSIGLFGIESLKPVGKTLPAHQPARP